MRLHRIAFALAFCSLLGTWGKAMAVDFVVWSSETVGTVDSVSLTAVYTDTSNLGTSPFDLTGTDYDPPGGASQQSVVNSVGSGITWTFSSPVTNVGLYLIYWRSSTNAGPSDDTYTFSAAPQIQSGLAGGSVSGNSFLTSPANGFYNGILLFPGPLTSLTLNAPNGVIHLQAYTLAVNVPEPSTYALVGIGATVLGILNRSRKSRKA